MSPDELRALIDEGRATVCESFPREPTTAQLLADALEEVLAENAVLTAKVIGATDLVGDYAAEYPRNAISAMRLVLGVTTTPADPDPDPDPDDRARLVANGNRPA